MSKEKLICGFCGREINTTENIGYLKFPDTVSRPVHLDHVGVKQEYNFQNGIKE
jgi:hypothetical protein